MQWRKHGTPQALPFFMVCTVILANRNQLIQERAKERRDLVHSYQEPVIPYADTKSGEMLIPK